MDTIKRYYVLAKPGIVYGNAISALAGFLLASNGQVDFTLLSGMLLGVCLSIGSACVFNNIIDRDIDRKMGRTKNRALAKGSISIPAAMIYGLILGIVGFLLMIVFTNLLTVIIGLIGFVDYIVFYGIAKRRSVHSTVIGSISGSMPIVAGYTAVTNRFDIGALVLFLVMTFWQMPHFYALAIFRLKDYANAGIPLLPIKKGIQITKVQMLLYVIAFFIATLLLTVYHLTGYIYLLVMGVIGLYWIWIEIKGFKAHDPDRWAKSMFRFSLIALMVFCIMISLQGLIGLT